MALKRNEFIEIIGDFYDVYLRIEEINSQNKGFYNCRCRKYIIKKSSILNKSFDSCIFSNIEVDTSKPIRPQLYNFINKDGDYEEVYEEGQPNHI